MACRYPGNPNSPESFWQLLVDGTDAIAAIPFNRWDREKYYDSNPATPGKMQAKEGGFVADVDKFDPYFFSISPREAESMDPQQRFLLEVSVEALQRSGINLKLLQGSETGVFIGATALDYADSILREEGMNAVGAHFATGNALAAMAGRIAYSMGLQGPVMAIDTACSSSLVAIHHACQSLKLGECTLAVAGGVNLMLTPNNHIILSKAHMLSPDGRCKTFDASANGYVRSEGCGIIILKSLEAALKDQNPILAIVRGSATNHAGKASGFTVPNGVAQERLLQKALLASGVEANAVGYVEMHGTGTSLGDPIEVSALGKVYGKNRSANQPLFVGSVKSNIGHLEPAAGVAGVMKAILCLQNGKIPKNLHLNHLNPQINLDIIPAKVALELTEWPSESKTRYAGISSFGFTGTNAHLILEEAPSIAENASSPDKKSHALLISAKSSDALQAYLQKFAQFLRSTPNSLAQMAYSSHTQAFFEYRAAIVAKTPSECADKIKNNQILYGLVLENAEKPAIAFLFTGQGSQYAGLGSFLYDSQPLFKSILDACAKLVENKFSLLDVLLKKECPKELSHPMHAQVALFTLEYALAKLLESWGVFPDYVLGQQVGAVSAAALPAICL